jgi:hypothetical protein
MNENILLNLKKKIPIFHVKKNIQLIFASRKKNPTFWLSENITLP